MNVGSLFSGIGGFDFGLERAGMRVAWQCEADPFCRRVLARHWPDVPCYPDVRELRNAERVDVLCGGFPCQDLSYAGKGAGIDGARSGLWSEYARLIGELRPGYVIVENVAALLARGLERVLGDLATLGYDAEWDCLPASAFGAPHRRDRLWLVAYPEGAEWGDAQLQGVAPTGERAAESGERSGALPGARDVADAEGLPVGARLREDEPRGVGRGRPGDGGGEDEDVQDADERALQPWRVGGRIAQTGGSEWWAVEPPVGRVAHGVPDRLDQLAALGNALVPQIAEWLGRMILRAANSQASPE